MRSAKRMLGAWLVVGGMIAMAGSAWADAGGQCKPADAKTIVAAQKKVDEMEKALAAAKTPAEKAQAQKNVDAVKAELARLECKDTPRGGQCTAGDAASIAAAHKKVIEAQKQLAAAQAELAKLTCGATSGGQCKPADAKTIMAAQKKVDAAQKNFDLLEKTQKATPAQKAAAVKELEDARAELAKLECKP